MTIQKRIQEDGKCISKLQEMFERWRRERLAVEDTDDEDATVENDEEQDTT